MNYRFLFPLLAIAFCTCFPGYSSDSEWTDSWGLDETSVRGEFSDLSKGKEEMVAMDVPLLSSEKDRTCGSFVAPYIPTARTSILAGSVAIYALYHYCTSAEQGVAATLSSIGANFYSIMGGAYLASNLVADPLKKYGYQLWLKVAPTVILSPSTVQLKETLKRAEANKIHWFPTTLKFYEQQIADGDYSIDTVKKLEIVSKLPTTFKRLNYELIRARAEVMLATYNTETRKAILNFLAEVCIASNSDLPIKRKSIFFLGDAGTGKTRMAHLIADILGVYLYIINLSTISSDELFNDHNKPSVFISAFTPKDQSINYTNNVILFDEVDKAICQVGTAMNYDTENKKAALLKLEDEDVNIIESKYFYPVVEYDLSAAIMIYCGNKIPKDVSFLTRLPTISFGIVAPNLKTDIATAKFKEQLFHLRSPVPYIRERDDPVIAQIIEADRKFSGVRALRKVCDSYAFHLVKVATLGHEDEPFDVEQCYKTYLTTDEIPGSKQEVSLEINKNDETVLKGNAPPKEKARWWSRLGMSLKRK